MLNKTLRKIEDLLKYASDEIHKCEYSPNGNPWPIVKYDRKIALEDLSEKIWEIGKYIYDNKEEINMTDRNTKIELDDLVSYADSITGTTMQYGKVIEIFEVKRSIHTERNSKTIYTVRELNANGAFTQNVLENDIIDVYKLARLNN